MATPTRNFIDTARISSFSAGVGTGLLFGDKWGSGAIRTGVTLTWSVPQGTAWYDSSYSYYGEWSQWYIFSATEIAGAVRALNSWAYVTNVNFVRVSDNQSTVGEIRFAKTPYTISGSDAHAYMPADVPRSGDIWMNVNRWNLNGSDANRPGTYDYLALMHEIGHALGLKHSFEGSIYNGNTVHPQNDNWFFTIMSYTASPWSRTASPDFYPTTPMYLDLVAIQHLYGRDTTTNATSTRYTFYDTQKYWQTIYDAGGNDTIVSVGYSGSVINLNPGTWSSLGAAINFTDGYWTRDTIMIGPQVVIEHATGGSGSDKLIGNSSNNVLQGNAGFDTISGGTGNDFLSGASGFDTLDAGAGNDTISGGLGNDKLAGGTGSDTFMFNTPLTNMTSGLNVDWVLDFNVKYDTIRLDDAIFKGITKGWLAKGAFALGWARDTTDRIIYEKGTGSLFYDRDGTGAIEKIKFATLPKMLLLTAADFYVY